MEPPEFNFPFTGLHTYQRAQEVWTRVKERASADPLGALLEAEVRCAVLRIARATALSRRNGAFAAELESARAGIHAAAAIADQLARRGTPVAAELQSLLSDAGRMLGALVRTLQVRPTEESEEVPAAENENENRSVRAGAT